MTRKYIQFIAICIGAVVFIVIAAHLLWPPVEPASEVKITHGQVAEYAYVASAQREVFHRPDCEWARQKAV